MKNWPDRKCSCTFIQFRNMLLSRYLGHSTLIHAVYSGFDGPRKSSEIRLNILKYQVNFSTNQKTKSEANQHLLKPGLT